jgi:hypothetical protein
MKPTLPLIQGRAPDGHVDHLLVADPHNYSVVAIIEWNRE